VAKLIFTEVKNFIESQGFHIQDVQINNSKELLSFKCPDGHEFKMNWNSFKNGQRCKYCSGRGKRALEEVRVIIEDEDYVLLSEKYQNNKQKLDLVCPYGHFFQMDFAHFFNHGNRCPRCIGKNKTYNEVKQMVESIENSILLSEKYEDANSKLKIQCSQGHIFNMSFDCFYRREQKCPYCLGRIINFTDIKEFIDGQEYQLLSTNYINAKEKLIIKCDKGHVFEKTWDHFKRGQRCPKCSLDNNRGENNWNWKGGISSIGNYLRNSIINWKKDSMVKSQYKCVITDKRFDVVHHLYGFDLILKETFEVTGIPIGAEISDYNDNELEELKDVCLYLHDKYPLGVCLSDEIHELFHKEYGYGNNTPEQFDQFKSRYKNGEFIQVQSAS
jgi:hypothetical protein